MTATLDPHTLYFLPLGGAGEIGMNLNLYAYDGKWLMVDCGMTFADESQPGVELVLPDPSFIETHRKELVGLVLTHAHEDHIGAVSHLWPRFRCPMFATPFTAGLLRRKLAEAGLEKEAKITLMEPGRPFSLGPFRITPIGITHSIPESQSLAIETPAGLVLHTGDWKLDPEPLVGPRTEGSAYKILGDRGVLAVIGDSTNVFRPGESGSEGAVRESLTALIASRRQRVAVTTFASNVARLESIAYAALDAGRHPALVGRSLWRMNEVARETGYLKGLPDFLEADEAAYLPPEKLLYICTGCQGEPRGAMARIASGNHPDVVLETGDTVIFSSKIIPGNEAALGRVQNQLALKGVDVITEKDAFVHVSGHPSRDEIAQMISWLRPRILVPVHGESRHMVEHARFAKSLQVPETPVIHNGVLLRLGPEPVKVMDEVPSGRLLVDASGLIAPQGRLMTTRKRVMHNGAVAVTLTLNRYSELAALPTVSTFGLAEDEIDPKGIGNEFKKALTRSMMGELSEDDAELAALAAQTVRRIARLRLNRRPVVDVHVLRLEGLSAALSKRDQERAK